MGFPDKQSLVENTKHDAAPTAPQPNPSPPNRSS
jgi:hypothetical protein